MAWLPNAVSILLSVGVLYGIRLMSSPKTAVRGNRLSALSMLAAVLLILWSNEIIDAGILWAGMIAGGAMGYVLAIRATMIKMPQIVALLNGLGGGASAFVALAEAREKFFGMTGFERSTSALALIIGAITLSGSLIAAAKLDRRMSQRPTVLRGHPMLAGGLLFVLAALTLYAPVSASVDSGWLMPAILALGLIYGVLFSIKVGGADMPVAISLLNALSGVAGAVCGLAIAEPLLVSVGAIVGASGLILTQSMCTAMNRSLKDVLAGTIAKATTQSTDERPPTPQTKEPPAEQQISIAEILNTAAQIVVVPGYGMAVAQAQSVLKELVDALEARGKEVRFGIHPVAGRMPGHMNVLLAEVDVDYEKMCDMHDINEDFEHTDLVLIVGACDVVNPAANTAVDTPIYGMPVLSVEDAKHVIVCNLDTNPGYSGVDNPLYTLPHVRLVLGDAKESIGKLLQELEG